jgi:hypothetical protein
MELGAHRLERGSRVVENEDERRLQLRQNAYASGFTLSI